MTEIERAVERLYETFTRYPRPTKIESCPCGCTKPRATEHLVAVPLRELRFADLEDYLSSAMTTQGSVDDFRYLLPRLFQGIVEEDCLCDPEILFGKLSYAKWMGWPADEVIAIRAYLQSLWRKGLNSFPLHAFMPAFSEIETLLSSIAQTGDALDPYLQTWTETKSREAGENLIQFVTIFGGEFSDGGTLNESFWGNSKPQAEALRRWLLRPDTLQRISNAADLVRNDGFEHLFPPAFEILQNQRDLT